MERFEYHYGAFLRKATKAYYFQVLKNVVNMIIGGLILLLCLGLFLLTKSIYLGIVSTALALVLIFEVVFYIVIQPTKQLKDPRLNKEINVSFDDKAITLITDTIHSQVAFEYFIRAWENEEFYLLFHTKKQFWFFPKAAFKGQEQEKKFRSHIMKYHKISTGLIRG